MSVNKYGGLGCSESNADYSARYRRVRKMTFSDYCVIGGKRYVIMNEGQDNCLLYQEDKVIFSGTYGLCQSRLNKII